MVEGGLKQVTDAVILKKPSSDFWCKWWGLKKKAEMGRLFYPSILWLHTSWCHPWLLSFSQIIHPIHQQHLLDLPSKFISRTSQLSTIFLATFLQKTTVIFLTSLFFLHLYSNGLFFNKVRLIVLNINQIMWLLCFKPCNGSHLAQSNSWSPDNGLKTQHVLFPNHVTSSLTSATLPLLIPFQVLWVPFCSSINPETPLKQRCVLTVPSTWILTLFFHLLFFYCLSTASRNICPNRIGISPILFYPDCQAYKRSYMCWTS